MSNKYDALTQEEFYEILSEIAYEEGTANILSVPGVYEILAEYFNNDVLERYVEKMGFDPEDDDETVDRD